MNSKISTLVNENTCMADQLEILESQEKIRQQQKEQYAKILKDLQLIWGSDDFEEVKKEYLRSKNAEISIKNKMDTINDQINQLNRNNTDLKNQNQLLKQDKEFLNEKCFKLEREMVRILY